MGAEQEHRWRRAVFYELFVPSFADGNGDGMGDLHGARPAAVPARSRRRRPLAHAVLPCPTTPLTGTWFQEALATSPGRAARARYHFVPGRDDGAGSPQGRPPNVPCRRSVGPVRLPLAHPPGRDHAGAVVRLIERAVDRGSLRGIGLDPAPEQQQQKR